MELIDSGNRWLGAIPEHWALSKIGHCFKHRNEIVSDKDFEPLSVTKNGVLPQLETAAKSDNSDGRKLIRKGDFVINQRSDRKGSAGVSEQDGSCSVIYTVLEPIKYDPRYAHHLFRSVAFQEEFYRWGTGIVDDLWSTRYSLMKQIACPVPPLDEQRAIADYLDRELGLIDIVASKQQSLLSLIKERKLAAIQYAITAEADSNRSRKLVHGTWFSSVPEDWQVLQIRRLSSVNRGSSPRPIDDPKYFDEQGEWSWVRIADASAAQGKLQQTTQRLSELGSSLSTKLLPGSLFVSIAGSVGKPCITDIKCCIHDGFVYFPNLSIDAMWLYRIFEAGLCFAGLGKLGTQLNLNTDTIGSITVPVPPPSEMGQILRGIEEDSRRFDGLIFSVELFLEVLAERKQALISAAVTGKIDIRGKN